MDSNALISELLYQRDYDIDGNLYWKTQIDFAYNSNKIEGGSLTRDQTRWIFDTNGASGVMNIDDGIEARNHFRMFDYMLDTVAEGMTKERMKTMHRILKNGVVEAGAAGLGEWKRQVNAVGNFIAVRPEAVDDEIGRLLDTLYNYLDSGRPLGLAQLAAFHHRFELIHPFLDGNGRIGRMLLFSLCLEQSFMPFIVLDRNKADYYAGLESFGQDHTKLADLFEREQESYSRDIDFFLGNTTAGYLNLKDLPAGFTLAEDLLRDDDDWLTKASAKNDRPETGV